MRYIIGVIVAVILFIIAIVVILSRGPSTPANQQGEQQVSLAEFANTDTDLRFTTRGQISASETHREVRITVGRDRRTFEVLKGYQGEIERSQSFDNTQAAYEAFLYAVRSAGFSRQKDPVVPDDRDACPSGRVYIYESIGGEEPLRLWNSTCSQRGGSFGGNPTLVRNLFQAQIPDYNRLVTGVTL